MIDYHCVDYTAVESHIDFFVEWISQWNDVVKNKRLIQVEFLEEEND